MKKMSIAILLILMISGIVRADLSQLGSTNEAVTVFSSTDGLGSFTYAFTEGTYDLFEIKLKDIVLQIDSSIITDIITPSGWETQIDQSFVQFSWTNSSPVDALSNIPIEFRIKTSYADSSINTEGIAVFSTPVGYNKFNYIQPIPEPSTIFLFGIGGFGAWLLRRNKNSYRK